MQSKIILEKDALQRQSGSTDLSPEFIEEVCDRLQEGKRIRRKLPFDGRLNIDRKLPFLIVYRRPYKTKDKGTEKLVIGEASYLVASGRSIFKQSLTRLIRAIVETQAEQFQAFLIIEIWSKNESLTNGYDPHLASPEFCILTSPLRPPTYAVETLEEALKRIKINRRRANISVANNKNHVPKQIAPLLPDREAGKLNCFIIGLEVRPIYLNPTTNDIYPLALRRMHLGVSNALKKAAFTFTNKQTNMSLKHFQSLGKRALVKSVWEIDKQLAEIDSMFNFLLLVTPVNTDQAWSLFNRTKFEKIPTFYYRLRPIDPALLKRRLYQIPIEVIEDPLIASIFREKRVEINRKLTMLEDRNLPQFLQGSIQLYGGISKELKNLAENILETVNPHSRNGKSKGFVNAQTFARRAMQEFEYYRQQYPDMAAKVEIRNDIVGLMVASGDLLVSSNTKIPETRVEALVQHEIGTHVLTYYNGKAQPFKQLYCGMPGYEELQEGLAVFAEYLVGGLNGVRLRLLAGRVIASSLMIDDASFIDTFRELNRNYGFEKRTSYTITVRTFRGGGLTKDAVYLRGLVQLLDYLKSGGDLDVLYVGKIALEHIPVIKDLQWRKVLKTIPLKPNYLLSDEVKSKINMINNIKSVLNLI